MARIHSGTRREYVHVGSSAASMPPKVPEQTGVIRPLQSASQADFAQQLARHRIIRLNFAMQSGQ